jgi:hypothetical protein
VPEEVVEYDGFGKTKLGMRDCLACRTVFPLADYGRLRHGESCYDEAVTLDACGCLFREEFEACPVCTLERHG